MRIQRAAILGDSTNHVCHWGTEGAGYINADVTVALSRLPIGCDLGLRADNTIASAGISIGRATLYDRTGPVGTCVVSTLSNARRQIDFSATTSAAFAPTRAEITCARCLRKLGSPNPVSQQLHLFSDEQPAR